MHNQCSLCALHQTCKQEVVPSPIPVDEKGLAKPFILAIGEAPGADEDERGEGFVGKAGKTLDRLLAVHGVGRNDYVRANIVRCRPPENRKPTRMEIEACLPKLAKYIEDVKPSVILAVGGTAAAAFFGNGSLLQRINERQIYGYLPDSMLAQPMLRDCLTKAIPMPHTSPLAFNRNAADGRKWSEIAKEQVAIAVSYIRT